MKRFASRVLVGAIGLCCLVAGSAAAAIESECGGPVSTNVRFGIAGTQLWLTLADRAAESFIANGDKLSAVNSELSRLARTLRDAESNDAPIAAKSFAGKHSGTSIVPSENGGIAYSVLTDDHGLMSFNHGGGLPGGFLNAGSPGSILSSASGAAYGPSLVSAIGPRFGDPDDDLANDDMADDDFANDYTLPGFSAPRVPGAAGAVVMPAFPNETRHGMASSPPLPAGNALVPSHGALELPEPSAILIWGGLALGGALVYRYRGAAKGR
jgi:hypothetical protein